LGDGVIEIDVYYYDINQVPQEYKDLKSIKNKLEEWKI
jgi:hypothetical protein